jgi:dolichol-phosphate mannosyltransferase
MQLCPVQMGAAPNRDRGWLLNTALLNFQFDVLCMDRCVANAVAIALVTAWNFWPNLRVSWRNAD